jgi:AhpD family alkylhydroperoxidase
VTAPGAVEPKVKEMLYAAVSITHGCTYCIHSHTASARAKGMTDQEYAEMIAIVGMAAVTNRLVTALGVLNLGLSDRRVQRAPQVDSFAARLADVNLFLNH